MFTPVRMLILLAILGTALAQYANFGQVGNKAGGLAGARPAGLGGAAAAAAGGFGGLGGGLGGLGGGLGAGLGGIRPFGGFPNGFTYPMGYPLGYPFRRGFSRFRLRQWAASRPAGLGLGNRRFPPIYG